MTSLTEPYLPPLGIVQIWSNWSIHVQSYSKLIFPQQRHQKILQWALKRLNVSFQNIQNVSFPQVPVPRTFCRSKTIFKVGIINTKSATIAFFPSPPCLLPARSIFPSFLRLWCDFQARWSRKRGDLAWFSSNGLNFRWYRFEKSS